MRRKRKKENGWEEEEEFTSCIRKPTNEFSAAVAEPACRFIAIESILFIYLFISLSGGQDASDSKLKNPEIKPGGQ